MSDELADRLTEEVTSLSTKLVTAVSKQSELEEKLFVYHKENHTLKNRLSNVGDYETRYTELSTQFAELQSRFDEVDAKKKEVEDENRRLNVEVEELTASLFDEANKMVSDASRETYNFKVKNRKLYEELDEKNTIIDNLQNQLADLKRMFEQVDDENKQIKQGHPDDEPLPLTASIFAPKLKAIRFDLANYADFKEFLYTIMQPTFVFDSTNLKLTRFFKRVWSEELEHSITIPSANILTRWQKGKFFWNLLIEGKIKIEPIKGVNETLKLDYHGAERNSIPIATKDVCGFCDEGRDDSLEHARLYSLKLLNPDSAEPPVIGEYPLCNYCLIKIRNICELFAKLRWYTKNGYKLPAKADQLTVDDECKVLKMYLVLLSIRAKIWWSKAGYWDTDDTTADIEEMHVDEIRLLLGSKEESKAASRAASRAPSVRSTDGVKSVAATPDAPEQPETTESPAEAPDSDEEFAEARESFEKLGRKNSKSQKFRAKVDTDLDETLQMLQESIDETT